MRRALSVLAGLVAAGAVIFAGILFWPAPAAPRVPATPQTPELIARGAYLATAADCIACHTTTGGAPYTGGRAFKLPFGTIYSPNITPDRETGIGAWTDGEFLRAMHKGIGRNGEQLYPAFPYTSYSKMTDADALAIKAYLFSLPPVRREVRKNGLSFPFNQRPIMKFWNILFLRDHRFHADEKKSAVWNRGAYLVTSLGHCRECHTPRNLLYGFSGRELSGETMQGWTAWNITSDQSHGIGAWSVDDLVAYFRYGYAPGRAVASGPMKEAIDFSLSKLSDDDRRAMAVYLKATEPSDRGPVANHLPASVTRSTLFAPAPGEDGGVGRQVFEGACASCHAWNGEGLQTPMAAFRGRRSVQDPKALNVMQTILRGGQLATPYGHASMPAFGSAYSDAEIAAAANYVVAHFGGVRGEAAPKDVAKARQD